MNIFVRQSRMLARSIMIGAWIIAKFERNQVSSGTLAAAKNARKMGIPLDLALLMLARGRA